MIHESRAALFYTGLVGHCGFP